MTLDLVLAIWAVPLNTTWLMGTGKLRIPKYLQIVGGRVPGSSEDPGLGG